MDVSELMQGIFLTAKGWMSIGVVVGLFIMFVRWKRSPAGRQAMDRFRLRVPRPCRICRT